MVAQLVEIQHESLRAKARSALRTSIVLGELVTDRLYVIGNIARQLGVSATPVREAVSDLESAGLVDIARNRGFYVRKITDVELDQILQIRLMLEVPAMSLVIDRVTPAALRRARIEADTTIRSAEDGDMPLFLEADLNFHLGLIELLENPRLLAILNQLRDQARLYGLSNLAGRSELVASAREHVNILRLIEEKNSSALTIVMTQHLQHTRGIWAGLPESR